MCKLIAVSLATGAPVNSSLTNACSQIAAIIDVWRRAKGPIRARICVGECAEVVTVVHSAWMTVARFNNLYLAPAVMSTRSTAAVERFAIDSFGDAPVELVVGVLSAMPKYCNVCNAKYRSTVNAQRCMHSQHANIVERGSLAAAWDAFDPEDKAKFVEKVAPVLCRFDSGAPMFAAGILRAIESPASVSGAELEESLAAVTEDTCYLKVKTKRLPEIDVPTANDNLAIVGFWFDLGIVGKILEDELARISE